MSRIVTVAATQMACSWDLEANIETAEKLVTFTLRFLCHFLSGWLIWEALWPNSYSYAAPVWSLLYNGSYMLPEIAITAAVAWLSFVPLKKYWLGEDLPRA